MLTRLVAFIRYMLKRLAEYEPGYGKRAQDAMTVGDPMGKRLSKRAAQSVVVRFDSEEYLEDEVNKEVENPTPLEKRFHYNPCFDEGISEGMHREYEMKFSNDCRKLLSEAFEVAAAKVLGDGHGIKLKFVLGGVDWDCDGGRKADAPAKKYGLFMTGKTIDPAGYLDVGNWGVMVNVPWGVKMMTVPEPPPGAAQQMQRLLSTFGLKAEGEAGWRMITVAEGVMI